MLGKKSGIKKKLTLRTGLAPEALGCLRLTVLDNTNLFIENYSNVSEYTSRRLGVDTGTFYITIEGEGLELESFGQENVSVRGEITSIKYEFSRKG